MNLNNNALTFDGVEGTDGQVLVCNTSGTPIWTDLQSGWVGTATSDLDMATYDITNCPSISNSTTITVGTTGQTTQLKGNVSLEADLDLGTNGITKCSSISNSGTIDITAGTTALSLYQDGDIDINVGSNGLLFNSTQGTLGQIVSCDANGTPSWTTPSYPPSTWVGTATSGLNMATYNITNCPTISNSTTMTVGTAGQTTSFVGNCNFPTKFSYGTSSEYLFFGGNGGNSTTASVNLGTSGAIARPFNIQYVLTLSGALTGQTVTLPPAQNGYLLYIVNTSSNVWAIARSGTDVIVNAQGGTASTSINLSPNKTLFFIQGSGAFVIIGETCWGSHLALNYAPSGQTANVITLAGLKEYEAFSGATNQISAYNTLNKNSVFRYTGGAGSSIALPTGTITAGYFITIRNDASSNTTVNITSASANIFDNTNSAPVSTYTLSWRHSATFYTIAGAGAGNTGFLMTSYA
jgi:hypothetical protein